MQQSARTIGLVAPYLGGIYYASIIAGAAQAAQRHGIHLLITLTPTAAQDLLPLAWEAADGWIVVQDMLVAERLARVDVPVVTLSSQVPGLPAVLADNAGGMYAAVSHLIDHGHERIAFIGSLANSDIAQRLAGYRAALADHNLAINEQLVLDAANELEDGGAAAARQLLAAGMPCTAIVASTDKNAFGIMEVVQAAGYTIPADLALIGFDDVPHAPMVNPALTTVRQRFDLLAQLAVDQLLAHHDEPVQTPQVLHAATTLIVRSSCGCTPHITSPLLAQGVSFPHADAPPTLAQRLIALLDVPVHADDANDPYDRWPGLATLITTLDCARTGQELPPITAIEQAWREACEFTANVSVLDAVCAMLEQVGVERLPAASSPSVYARLAATTGVIRSALLRARVAHESQQIAYLDSVLYANHSIGGALLGTVTTDAPALEWLAYTPAVWGCLGLWADPMTQTMLTVTASYARNGSLRAPIGSQSVPAMFPFDVFPEAPPALPPDVITVLPIHTARRAWGVLALGGVVTQRATWNSDPVAMWVDMLAAALDRAALLADLHQQQVALLEQQTVLQAAYDREHLFTSTIRDLGSPIIPLMPGVILMPLIGAIDAERAQQIIAVGSAAVQREQAHAVIVDVTGISTGDMLLAGTLIHMVRLVQLLGAQMLLVGVRPELAQHLVRLGSDTQVLQTQASVAAALRRVMSQRRVGGV